ncbi:2OG-Fe(II) oxygenase [Roseateles asaccharophilus]|uniref:Prolyl 4-hydroxylase alpha subunit domain-containing protein n=1 Tax=Roseateles asaccharophilus TaxID=582607 RepID=A0ABU2A859_9BURK|nr:2OG-Fe(II) oxygenase [Roseateles asaccharophilus]MDR7333325.1 hypothetical protein [Roseateles asaccharophilus]
MTTPLHDRYFITLYAGLDEATCRAVIERFDSDEGKRQGRIGGPGQAAQAEQVKRSWDLEIRHDGDWQEIFQRIHPRIQAFILQSFDLQATGYKIQMYLRGDGHFRWHAHSVGGNTGDRVVAMVLYLNDVARGGETEFFHQGLKIQPRAGQLVLFPAGWNYMHCGHVPESGDKYVISTFIRIKG